LIVLAKRAAEVAAEKSGAEYTPSRKKVVQGFFFYGVKGKGGKPREVRQRRLSRDIAADGAFACLSIPQETGMGAKPAETAPGFFFIRLDIEGGDHIRIGEGVSPDWTSKA
jgi:hypothetical protein